MDRTEVARAIAKVFAYLGCGKPELARPWADKIINWLQSI